MVHHQEECREHHNAAQHKPHHVDEASVLGNAHKEILIEHHLFRPSPGRYTIGHARHAVWVGVLRRHLDLDGGREKGGILECRSPFPKLAPEDLGRLFVRNKFRRRHARQGLHASMECLLHLVGGLLMNEDLHLPGLGPQLVGHDRGLVPHKPKRAHQDQRHGDGARRRHSGQGRAAKVCKAFPDEIRKHVTTGV